MNFQRATKKSSRLRLALIGPSGSGKTYTALMVAKGLGGQTALIDTEHGSAAKYADLFDFDTLELETFSPLTYVDAIQAAAAYDNLVIDSLSHAWMGKDGALEQKDRIGKRSGSNDWTAWRDVTPMHNQLVDAILASKSHVIATMRSKTEYVQEKDERTGKTTVRKVGMAPVQRDGLEYEFDVVGDMNYENELIVTKTRLPKLAGQVIKHPGLDLACSLLDWLGSGAPASEPVVGPPFVAPSLFASKEQVQEILQMEDDLVEAGLLTREQFNAGLRKSYDCAGVVDLSPAQAEELRARLDKKLEEIPAPAVAS